MRIDPALLSAFSGLGVVELRMEGLSVKSLDPALELFKGEVEGRTRKRIPSLEDVRAQPIFRAYRDFFWKVGIDPTKVRPASEALTRKVLGGRGLPRINTLVDAYNLASIETGIAVAAFDMREINDEALQMRKAARGERFRGIGMSLPEILTGVEVVIEDRNSRELVAVYPYRDAGASRITNETHRVLFMMCGVPGIELSSLETAKSLTRDYVGRFCSSSTD